MTTVDQTHPVADNAILTLISDVFMLALTVWREARAEPYAGKLAVAQTVMNRVRRPSWWGRTVLEVITKKWQYSSITDPKDLQLTKWPSETDKTWKESLQIAFDVLHGTVGNPVPGADSYYAVSMPTPPNWAKDEFLVAQIGNHRFYNLDRDVEAAVVNSQSKGA